jgi:hypothetical protein
MKKKGLIPEKNEDLIVYIYLEEKGIIIPFHSLSFSSLNDSSALHKNSTPFRT